VVLASAMAMFVSTSALLWLRNQPARSGFVRWYAPALLLIATGLFGITIQTVHGGWVGWTSRAAQWLGSSYMIVAALVSVRESGALKISLEAAVRESEQRYRALVELAPDAILITQENRIAFANAAALRLFGATTPEQVVGQSPFTLFHPEFHALIRERTEQLWAGKTVPVHEQRIVRLDGKGVDVEVAAGCFETDGRRTLQVIVRDITERKEAQEALRTAQATLQQHAANLEKIVAERTAALREAMSELEGFSYSIAHDMRAPLRAMHGFAQVLQEECSECLGPDGKDYLLRITRSAKRLDNLIQDVLNYSKILRAELSLESVDPEALIHEIIESYPNLHPARADIRIDRPLPKLLANPAALTQIFSNLLGNAVKFVATGVKPQVQIRASVSNTGRVRLWFEDNGIGIDTEVQEQIFMMFQRLHPQDQFEGTGIGLTIVRKAVERMGGAVGVASELGQGSRFWIELDEAKAIVRPVRDEDLSQE
jgi:PAS domain S-box-containing protein